MICVDSDCIIDFLRNKAEAVRAIGQWKDELVTTEVSRFQVMFGIFDKKSVSEHELSSAREFFASLDVLPFSEGCGESAAQILASLRRRGAEIDEADCFIAASALQAGCKRILTRNTKHFGRISGIVVVAY